MDVLPPANCMSDRRDQLLHKAVSNSTLLGGGFDLGAGKLGADFGRLNYLLRGKG